MYDCFLVNFLSFLLAKELTSETWTTGKKYCKDRGTYPVGNLSLSDITLTCEATKGTGSATHWIGVVKEMYQKEDQGNFLNHVYF